MTVGDHLVDGKFKSDKYAWCPAGFLALKLTDRAAQDLLWEYAQRHRDRDPDLSDDLETALVAAGFQPPLEDLLADKISAAVVRVTRAMRVALRRVRP